mmetsp:Transcript_16517/g.27487  ORF Transcript_16517/g.27487 Transcript_16517/m.27487 type:complete len:200 (+) Transcript_16517:967-1566(+)
MAALKTTRARPEKLPHRLEILLNRCDLTLAEANRPSVMAEMTTARAVKSEAQSKLETTSSSYEYFVYRSRLRGSITTDISVDMAVMVTLNARSALNIEQNQFEYDPPGLLVTTSRVRPLACDMLRVLTTMNPKRGNTTNCRTMPVRMAVLFFICFAIALVSTVADIPKTRKKSRREPHMSTHGRAVTANQKSCNMVAED